jgi:hypothetical protein
MRRSEYEKATRTLGTDPKTTRYAGDAKRLSDLLKDLNVQVVLYKEGQYYRFKIIDIKTEAAVLEGLNPLYANPNDYRTVLLALHAKDLLIEELLND